MATNAKTTYGYSNKFPEIVTDKTINYANAQYNVVKLTAEQYNDLLHHTHKLSDLVDANEDFIDGGGTASEVSLVEFNALKSQVNEQASTLESLQSILDSINDNISIISGSIESLSNDITSLSSDIEELKNNSGESSDPNISSRLSSIESRLTNLESNNHYNGLVIGDLDLDTPGDQTIDDYENNSGNNGAEPIDGDSTVDDDI